MVKFGSEILKSQDVFLYGFGLAGRWLSANCDIKNNIKGFIDTDFKKVGKIHNKLDCISIETAQKLCNEDTILIITVVDIQDVLPILKVIPHKKWIALGAFLDNTQVLNSDNLEESNKFIEYTLKAVEDCHKGWLNPKQLFMRSIDVVITERCSLKCKDCSNLMQYFEVPVNITYDEIIDDFNNLMSTVDHIYEIRLIGGEPFMNKDIYKIIEYLTKCPKITKLVIYSNAMVPIKPEYQNILRDKKVVFALTNYEDYAKNAKNTLRVTESLDAIGVAYRLHPPETWTDSGVIKDFKRTINENKKLFSDCCGKNLLTVTDGKLYRCPFAANADRLNAVPKSDLNSVSVKASSKEITDYISKIDFLPACNWCKGRSWDSPEIIPAVQTVKPLPYVKYEKKIETT